jgi:hypothetical protein
MNTIEYFKLQSKNLYKDFKTQNVKLEDEFKLLFKEGFLDWQKDVYYGLSTVKRRGNRN